MRYLYISLFLSAFALNTNAQIITTVAGIGVGGYSGDGGQATDAELYLPENVKTDAIGNIYIADKGNNRIRKINTSGIINTVAGNGTQGYSGDGGQATAAELFWPYGITFDRVGNMYISDVGNARIRKVNTLGIISTIIGNGIPGYNGDGIYATDAKLDNPYGIAFDAIGNIYIADGGNNRIRKVDTLGIISSIAGNGTANYSGDGGQATAAEITLPAGITLDVTGNIYFTDYYNDRVRKINTLGIISTIAGNGYGAGTGYGGGFSGDGGQATAAELYEPSDVILDSLNNIYIADWRNNRIRMVNTLGIICTIAGDSIGGFSGDGGQATSAEIFAPDGLAFDASGNLYFADSGNNRIRKVTNVGQAAGIQQLTGINNQVTIYPNPATNSLQVSYAGNTENTELKVLNMLGEVVMEPTTYHSQNFTVDVSQFTSGVYIVELSNPSGKLVKRLIKK